MATIATLAVNVIASTNPFSRGMKTARGELTGFRQGIGSTISSLSNFVAPLVAITGASLSFAAAWAGVRRSFANIDDIAKTADKLGLTTEALGGLQHAASLTAGVGDKQFNTALQRMTRRIAEAAMGTGEAKGAIEELGLSAKVLDAAGPDRAFLTIADAMRTVDGQSNRLRLAFKLFDSEGAALVNTLNQGSGAITEMMREADELGITFDRMDAAKIEEFNDATTQLQGSFTGLFNELAISLAPALSELVDLITEGVVWLRGAIEWTAKLSDGMETLGVDLKFVSVVILAIIGIIGSLVIAYKLWAAAQAIVLALSGPQGWAILAAGAAIGAVAVAGVAYAFEGLSSDAKAANDTLASTRNETLDAAQSMYELEKGTGEASKRMKELAAKGESITTQMRTPVEIFRDRIYELNDLVNVGVITWQTYGRAVDKARESLVSAKLAKDAMEKSQGPGAAVVRGTTAAFGAVQSAQRAARDAAEQKRRDDRRDDILRGIERSAGVIATKPSQEIIVKRRGL